MRKTIGYALAAASVVFATGCSDGKSLDIGDGKHPAASLGASLADYAGSWDGHAEAYEFFDGSDRVRLSIDEDGTGVLEVGDSPALPAPDPEVGYPPNSPDNGKGIGGPLPGFYPGFEYPIDGANVESKRIRFTALTREVFREWCELQTPGLNVGAFPESYSCAPGGFGSSMPTPDQTMCTTGPDGATPIDCGKGWLCLSTCECDADSCSIYEELDSRFDAVLQAEGEELEGTLVIQGERVVVRMTRQ